MILPPEVMSDDLANVRNLNAQGGFSNLFLAHKTDLDIEVVIKRIKGQMKGKINEESEARIMTALRHQYLPRVYALRTASDGYVYTVMEYIEGETLRDYVKKYGALDQKQVFKWTKQLCEVISYMHKSGKKGIIHSDLKPENIMITPQGDICVIDFNASLQAKDNDEDLDAIGATVGYAAPEQYNLSLKRFSPDNPLYPLIKAAQGYGHVTYRTDIYAIGALAYFMLVGHDPENWNQKRIPLTRYRIVLGDAFRSVIECAMELNPAKRYKTADDMLHALNSLGRTDKRYRAYLRQCGVTAIIVGLLMAASVYSIVHGMQLRSTENDTAYESLILEAQTARTQKDFDICAEKLIEASRIHPDRIEAYLELGAVLYDQGKYQEVIDFTDGHEFRQSETMERSEFFRAQGQIAYLLGSCYYRMENYRSALMNYEKAAEYLPEETAYQRDLAVCCAKCGAAERAENILAALSHTDADPADLALITGEIAYSRGEFEIAFEQFSIAASKTVDAEIMRRAYIQGAQSCAQLGENWIDREIDFLMTGVSRLDVSQNSILFQMLGDTYFIKSTMPGVNAEDCYNASLGAYQNLISRGHATYDIRMNYAIVLEYLGRFDESESYLAAMQNDFPNNYRIPMQAAFVCADREGKKDAVDRNYQDMVRYYETAEPLYKAGGKQDSDMEYLEDLISQLKQYGWIQ
ncbi:MAG: protein kinase [Clostridia bacterium]|nr:protein kinase [Clostridia bacterium]